MMRTFLPPLHPVLADSRTGVEVPGTDILRRMRRCYDGGGTPKQRAAVSRVWRTAAMVDAFCGRRP